jgi:uncharacterized protein YegL
MSSHLIIMVDTSYSVQPYINPYIDTINGMISEQRKINPNMLITLISFNENIEPIFFATQARNLDRPINNVNLRITGTTSLYDCLDKVLDKVPDHNNTDITLILLTDGDDTSSKKSNIFKVKDKMSRKKIRYIFLGVSEVSINISKFLGFTTNILYKPTEQCFKNIIEIINPVLDNKFVGDVDVSNLENLFSSIKI